MSKLNCTLQPFGMGTFDSCNRLLVPVRVTYFNMERFFFLSGFSFTDTDDLQDSKGREGTIFYSTLPFPPAHKHSDIYLQLCMWDDYHIFLIAPLVFTRLLLDEIYYFIELPFDWLMMWRLFFFVYLMISF